MKYLQLAAMLILVFPALFMLGLGFIFLAAAEPILQHTTNLLNQLK